MTARQCYEAILVELQKENAPNIMLEDFNYLFNKAINLYVNKRYNIYDINQQTTDDLRVLKATTILTPNKVHAYNEEDLGSMMGATYSVIMPQNYLHILNCICIFKVKNTFKCHDKGDIWRCPATRLTADTYSRVLDNFWTRPTYRRPYYYIHNINSEDTNYEIDPYTTDTNGKITGNDYNYTAESSANTVLYHIIKKSKGSTEGFVGWYDDFNDIKTLLNDVEEPSDSSFLNDKNNADAINFWVNITNNKIKFSNPNNSNSYDRYLILRETVINNSLGSDGNDNNILQHSDINAYSTVLFSKDETSSAIEKTAGHRYGNRSSVRMEIRYGTDDDTFELTKVYVDYIKAPQYIRLTQGQLDKTIDTSQLLEFPDYVCQEIINELVNIIMENIGDPRLLTHPVVSQSIANPAQQLEPAVQQTAQ